MEHLIAYHIINIFDIGLTCSNYTGIPLQAKIQSYSYLGNPRVCCPSTCGSYCNECNGNEALQPEYCSVHNNNMCYQGNGNKDCCASTIIKTCQPVEINSPTAVNAPCRLSK